MDSFLPRGEHEEFAKRMDDEHSRQNRRISDLETAVKQYGALTVAVEKMATNMESMLGEQKKQGERLEALESRDGKKWREFIKYVGTTVAGIILGYFFKQLGV